MKRELVAVLGLVLLTSTRASANDAQNLIDAIAARDPATVATYVKGNVAVEALWFRDAKCARFANASVDAKQVPALVECLAELRIQDDKDGFLYEPGVRLEVDVHDHAWTAIRAVRKTTFGKERPEISAGTLEAHRSAGTADVVPSVALLAHAMPGQTFSADLDFCVDREGRVSQARVADESNAFGATVVDWTKAWRFRPIVVEREPVAVCAHTTIRYAVPVLGRTSMAANIAPTALEGLRDRGDKHVTASAAAKHAQGDRKMIASYKLCIDPHGNVTSFEPLKSSGVPEYDRDIERAVHDWHYRPSVINGVASPVCSAVTFIEPP